MSSIIDSQLPTVLKLQCVDLVIKYRGYAVCMKEPEHKVTGYSVECHTAPHLLQYLAKQISQFLFVINMINKNTFEEREYFSGMETCWYKVGTCFHLSC